MIKEELSYSYHRMSGSPFQKAMKILRTPGVHANIIFRIGHALPQQPLFLRILARPLYVYLRRRTAVKWGISIGEGAEIGKHFWIAHFGGVFVDGDAVIGDDVSISHDVTIGKSGTGRRRGAPTIGNGVYIAPGAKIAGKITIGNNVRIGANAVVERDIPANALVQTASVKVVIFPSYAQYPPGE